MIHKTKEQEQREVEQLFADFAAGSWQVPETDPVPTESTPPEAPKQKPPAPKKRFHKKLLIAILAAAVYLGLVTAYLVRPLPMQIVTLSSGANHIKAVCKDGTVLSTISGEWVIPVVQDTAHWTDIVSISVGDLHTLGLKKDGTVVSTEINYLNDAIPAAVSSTTYDYMQHGQTEASGWTDIVAVAAGQYHSVGLRKDGTVAAIGDNSSGQCEVSEWRNIVAIDAGDSYTVGLRKDGTVITTASQDSIRAANTWTDITAISAGGGYVLGLRDDGTVVAAGSDVASRCAVATWTNIISIAAGTDHSVGLRKDGTVVTTRITQYMGDSYYYDDYGQTDVDHWQNIVAIDTTQFHTVGLTADGKVVIAGLNSAPYTAVKQWENIQVP